MVGMTAVTEQPGMAAGCRRHPLSNFGVARQALFARWLERIAQGFERFMRVCMTMQAITNFKMQLTCMALVAVYFDSGAQRGVLLVTVDTTNLCAMLPSPFGKHL